MYYYIFRSIFMFIFICSFFIFLFFFFQAEDGIRDRNVTGVQTCALPICKEERKLLRGDLFNDVVPVGDDIDVVASQDEEFGELPEKIRLGTVFGITLPIQIGRASCRERV